MTVHLADPDESPQSDVVIWDGECSFCRQQVERLSWFDGSRRLSYISLHDPRVAQRFPELTYQQMMDQLWLATADGRRFGGADALRYLSRRLPRLWWSAPLFHLPGLMPVWRWGYRQVAQRRYRLAGKVCANGACSLHIQHKPSNRS